MRWLRHPGRALDAYLDGELDSDGTDRVATHLARCPRCRRRASLTGQIRRALWVMAWNAGS